MKSLKIFMLSFIMVFALGLVVFAQETEPAEVNEAVNLDENIQASDLGIGEPSILPDNPLYFLKNWGRGIRSLLALNPVAKSELKEKFANEKLIELKKMVEQKKNSEVIKRASENYQQEVEEVKNQADKIKEKAKEDPKVESFLDKFIQQQTLHQKLLQKMEEQVPSEALEKIKETRETHLERFQDVMLKLEDRMDKITEKLDKTLKEQKGSEFKEFKNLEVLKNLEEKVPEQAKEAIQRAQENALKRLQGDLEKMSPEDQEKFKEYTEKISGAKEKQLEILENLKAGIKAMPTTTPRALQMMKKLEQGKAGILEKIDAAGQQIDCPKWSVIPEFCKEGRVIMEKSSAGCFTPRCIIPGDTTIVPPAPPATGITPIPPSTGVGRGCITLWDPVCGENGKTYSNACFAKVAGIEIDYKGVCRENAIMPTKPGVCIQVITPALSPEGICKEFPTPCDMPSGWKKVDRCPEK